MELVWAAVAVVVVVVLVVVVRAASTRSAGRSTPSADVTGVAEPGGLRRSSARDTAEPGDDHPPAASSNRSAGSADTVVPLPGAGTGPGGSGGGPAVHRPEPPLAADLAELLRGVELPCGLAPSPTPDQPQPDRYLALVTSQAGPGDVGRALEAELARLGFELFWLSEDEEAVARRADDVLSMRLHPEAATASAGGRTVFPHAAPGTVGVELWSGAGPNPHGD